MAKQPTEILLIVTKICLICSFVVFLTQLLISFCWMCLPLVPTPPAFSSYMLIPLFFEPSLALSSKQTVYKLNWGLAIKLNKKKVQPFTLSKEKRQAQHWIHWWVLPSTLPVLKICEAAKDSCLISQQWYVSPFRLLSYHWTLIRSAHLSPVNTEGA